MLLVGAGAFVAAQADPQPLQRMVASERAFAAATAELGVRDGFLTFLAGDAVQIEAGQTGRQTRLVSAVTALGGRPLAPLPLGAQLLWNPHAGQVSGDGSLGWLTGPYVVMNQGTRDVLGQGAYFSVWKRQPDGTWRVWLDEGIELPEIWRDAAEFRASPASTGGTGGSAAETPASAEAAVASGGDPWHERWSESVRIHRQGRMPIVGRDAAGAWAAGVWSGVTFHLVRVERAASDDLAVAVGGYDARTPAGAEHGTWVRVWARDVTGRWRIVFETNKAAG
jgi:ketosteroid isomerase-like protein